MRLLVLCLLLLSLSPAWAQKVVIFRCTDANGALTVQNDVPCPKGSKQDRRVIDAAPSASMPPAFVMPPPAAKSRPQTSAPVAPIAAIADAPPIADADRLPPPALFECRTYDAGRYLSDDGNPPQRCAPLQTTGIGGSSGTGAGESCQMVSDQCQRIADGGLCENWKARLLEAQAALRFGRRDNHATAQAEVDRVARIVRESTCGK